MSTIHPTNPSPTPYSGTHEPAVLLEDLTAGLIWPTLLKAPSMAFSPPRLLLGIIGTFLLAVVYAIHAAIFTPELQPALQPTHSAQAPDALAGSLIGLLSLNPAHLLGSLSILVGQLTDQLNQSPWSTIALTIPVLLVVGTIGHAITRSASIEFAYGRQTQITQALSASLRTIRQITLATLGPLVVAAVLAGLIMIVGLTLGLPVFNIIGSVLYIIALVLSVLLVCLLTLHLLTLPLSISALAIEGTDAFDALQRSYAYLIARPIRLAIYIFILLMLGAAILTVVEILATWSIGAADALASTLTNDAGRRVLTGGEDLGATEPFAHRVITLARSGLQLIVAGYVLSLLFCSSTLAYLCIRRICDGQDIAEIWDPETAQY